MFMASNYSQVLERLFLYRNELGKTQQQMSLAFDVTQGHYAKLESGAKIISYQSLKHFEAHGGDIHFLLTGTVTKTGEINNYMSMCKTEEGKKWLFEALVWLFHKCGSFYLKETPILSPKTYKSLQLLKHINKENTIWECIRKNENLSQIKMAEHFDINVKRYRRIEKLKVAPDAEILNTLYCRLHYSPLVILNREMYFLDELNQIWNAMPESAKDRLKPLLQEILTFIQLYEKAS